MMMAQRVKGKFEFETQILSNRQFSFLAEAMEKGGVTLERMLEVSQTTAGSVVRRGFLAWSRVHGRFEITAAGYETMEHFQHSDIGRAAMYRPFSKFIQNRELDQLSKEARARFKEQYNQQKERSRKA